MVCAEHTIGSEIILDTPDATQRDMGEAEAHLGPFRDNFNLDAR